MSNPQHSDSIIVARRAEDLYDMVADVTRTRVVGGPSARNAESPTTAVLPG